MSDDKELRKIFEETTTRNLKMVVAYSEETRKIVRNLEEKILCLQQILIEQNKTIELLKLQLSNVQTKLYSGGTD